MPQSRSTPIPCHLLAGPLGVGKTTAIIDYLKRHQASQFVAVLVNDFGPVGLDSAIIAADASPDGEGLSIVNVPGGCVCCSAAEGLVAGFIQIAKLPRLDRIIIEPSGVAMPGEIVDLISQLTLPFEMELRPTMVIVDPGDVADLDDPAAPVVPYFEKMIEAADALIANRCDKASAQTMAKFHAFAAAIYPPKLRVITTTHGVLPDELFELRAATVPPARLFSFEKQLHQITQLADGVTWPATLEFRLDALLPRIKSLAQHGWKLIEVARGEVHCKATGYRGDNRADWITSGGAIPANVMKSRLIEALKQPMM